MGWEIVLVPEKPPVFFQESTVDVVASNVEPKLANTLVRKLCQAAPLENLRHVKRVRRRAFEGKNELCIILCPAFGGENQLEGIPDDVQSLIDDYQLRPFIAKVPKSVFLSLTLNAYKGVLESANIMNKCSQVAKYAASSKEEWEDQCKVWPTSYHPMIKADSVTEFTSEDSQWIVRCMKAALSLAKLRQLSQEVVNAALIVDPSSRELVAWAIDQTSSELSTNNIMEGSSCTRDAELLSFSESDENDVEYYQTLFHLYNSQEFSQSCVGVSCLFPRRWLEQKHHNEETTVNQGSKHSWHPLRHAAMVAIEKAADRDRQLFPNPSHLENSPNFGNSLQNSLISFPTKRQKTQMAGNEEKLVQVDSKRCSLEVMRPYLCTGFDIYIVWEPCTMCAMALVHQRIRRIFYAFPNPNAGALGSIHRLQGEKSLNHHYSVFRVSIDGSGSSIE